MEDPFDGSAANAINDAGTIVGWSDTADGERHAFRYRNGQFTDLGTLGEAASTAYDINNHGLIVGTAADVRGFLYDEATETITDLNTLVSPGSGWLITSARAINDAGQILATGYHAESDQYRAVLLNPVPEPAMTALLFAAAGGGLVCALQGKRRRWRCAPLKNHP